ncbi:MAG: hypothetical protein R3E50_10735 [Halioglobus sp.]
MTHVISAFLGISRAALVVLLALALPAFAEEAQSDKTESGGRAVAAEVEAVVTAIDLKTREVSLRTPSGFVITLVAPERVIKLEDVKVGDRLVGSFYAAIEAELRAPTETELAEPWKVLEESAISGDTAQPGVEAARLVRAVVTIEGVNKETGIVVVKDSRGRTHFISGVDPQKLNGVSVGQTAVIVFTEAMALTLEKQGQPAK